MGDYCLGMLKSSGIYDLRVATSANALVPVLASKEFSGTVIS